MPAPPKTTPDAPPETTPDAAPEATPTAAARRLPWTRTDSACLLGLVLLGLALRMVHFTAIAPTAYMDFPRQATQTDMYAVWQWAGQILQGDWLGRDTYHPDFQWMRDLGDRADWARWWGDWHVFQQEPGYPYFVALARAVGLSLPGIILLQLLIGSLQGLTVYLPGRELGGRLGGLIAGVLATAYGPLIFNQGIMLRDWIEPLLMPLLIWGMILARRPGSHRGVWLAVGLGMGAMLWIRAFTLLMLPVVLLWAAWPRERWRPAWRPLAITAAGIFIGFSPLMARNALVGAPLLAIHNRTVEAVMYPNLKGADPIGLHLPKQPDLLERAGGSTLAAMEVAGESHHWNPWSMVQLLWWKVRGVIDPHEEPNNTSYDYGTVISPILGWLPGFGMLLPLALAGLVVVGVGRLKPKPKSVLEKGPRGQGSKGPSAENPLANGKEHSAPRPLGPSAPSQTRSKSIPKLILRDWGLIGAWVGLALLAVLATTVLGRYRFGMVPGLSIFAGAGLAGLTAIAPPRRWAAGLAAAATVVIVSLLQRQAFALRPPDQPIPHPLSYAMSLSIYQQRGEDRRAFDELHRYLQHIHAQAPGSNYDDRLARVLVNRGVRYANLGLKRGDSPGQVQPILRSTTNVFTRYFPAHAEGYFRLGVLWVSAGDPRQGRAMLEHYLEMVGPDGRYAPQARSLLAKIKQTAAPTN